MKMMLLSTLIGIGFVFVFGIPGIVVLLITGIAVLVLLEWQDRREKRILKERLDIIMTMAEETQSMINKARSELEETRLNIS